MPTDATEPTWSEVKAAYWRNHKRTRAQVQGILAQREPPGPDDDFWAWEYVDALWRKGDRAALDRLVDLADSASDDDELGYLGAGPIEDLVRVFGESLIDNIEVAARRSPNFLGALRNIYGTVIPETIRVRMLSLVPASAPENRIRREQGRPAL